MRFYLLDHYMPTLPFQAFINFAFYIYYLIMRPNLLPEPNLSCGMWHRAVWYQYLTGTYCLHHQGFFYPEDGSSTSLWNQTTWSHIPEDSNIHGHHCENCKSLICQGFSVTTLLNITAVVQWLTNPYIPQSRSCHIMHNTNILDSYLIVYKSWCNTMYKCRNRAEHSKHFRYVVLT